MIQLQDISLRFDDNIIFDHFNFKVNPGDKILITGKSGRGKSTLLKILLGFCPIDSGTIWYQGKKMPGNKIKSARQDFSYVNQDVTLRDGIVSEILVEISKFDHNRFSGSLDKELMDFFEFKPTLLSKNISQLSGGERQRLGLMIAIKLNRNVYLLDEVTSALDTNLKDKVAEYFANLDATVIVVSHDSCFKNTAKFQEVTW